MNRPSRVRVGAALSADGTRPARVKKQTTKGKWPSQRQGILPEGINRHSIPQASAESFGERHATDRG